MATYRCLMLRYVRFHGMVQRITSGRSPIKFLHTGCTREGLYGCSRRAVSVTYSQLCASASGIAPSRFLVNRAVTGHPRELDNAS